ncbi:hypothetical protein GCM10029992_12450 [Glycomyces albus]
MITEVLDRAVARGELAERPDTRVVHALLLGPIFYRLLILVDDGEPVGNFTAVVSETVTAALLSGAARP